MAILLYNILLYPIIYIFPAYAANGAPVIFGGGAPLDLGAKIGRKRLFGPHKTIRGTFAGIAIGIIAGALEGIALPYMFMISIPLAVGAICGDLIGSAIKRRIGMKSGARFPVMDQFGFVAVALLFAFPFGHLPNPYGLAFILLLTLVLHPLTNMIANRLRLKSVPW